MDTNSMDSSAGSLNMFTGRRVCKLRSIIYRVCVSCATHSIIYVYGYNIVSVRTEKNNERDVRENFLYNYIGRGLTLNVLHQCRLTSYELNIEM